MNTTLKIARLLFGLLGLLLCLQACTKEEEMMPPSTSPTPTGTRYLDPLFSDIQASKNVKYGNNRDQAGVAIDLLMNIYEPANDTETNRPLIILAHGGGFAEGDKEDFDELAQKFARAGYVAATMGYRLIGNGADPSLAIALVDALHDMKAAVRYFNSGKPFNTDPNNIFIGGFSAGAVTALHYAYLDESNLGTAPSEIQNYLSTAGGLSGNSGNPGASERIKGVLNIAGGLFTTDWIDPAEPRLYSIHGTLDVDVYCTKDPEAISNPGGDFTEGSCLIHPILDSLGITNQFRQIVGGDHGAYFTCTDCDEEMKKFVFDNL
ncbi:MAG: alpha/beta hydrolase [Bacteroidota bacterium]